MSDLRGPDPRFVEELWARMELEAFGQQPAPGLHGTGRRPAVLLAIAAAVTAAAMLTVSSLTSVRAVDRLELDRAVPGPTPTPAQVDELPLLPDPPVERADGERRLPSRLALQQPEPSAAAMPWPVSSAGPRSDGPLPAAVAPAAPVRREQRIVFSSRRTGNGEIYTMRLDGSDVQQLTASSRHLFSKGPDWSPDGRWIAYGSAGNGLVVMRSDGSDPTVVAKNACAESDRNTCPGDHQPSWSPDGQWLVFGRGHDETADCPGREMCASLWLVRRDGSGLRRLTTTGREPHWSPDGQRIVFVDGTGSSNPACSFVERNCPAPLFTIRPDGTDRRPLGLVGDHPRWSPDGRSILYGSQPAGQPHDLYVSDAHGKQVRRVTHGPGASGGGAWSPDGTWIVYHYLADNTHHLADNTSSDNDYEIYLRRADGTGTAQRLTTSRDYDLLPRFSPG